MEIVEAGLPSQACLLRFMFSLKYLSCKIILDSWLIMELKSTQNFATVGKHWWKCKSKYIYTSLLSCQSYMVCKTSKFEDCIKPYFKL